MSHMLVLFVGAAVLSIFVLTTPTVRFVFAHILRFLTIVCAISGVIGLIVDFVDGRLFDGGYSSISLIALAVVPYIALRALIEFGDRSLPVKARQR